MNEECKIDGCEKPVAVKKRNLCRSHYYAWTMKNKPRGKKPCAVAECDSHMYAKGYCQSHYDKVQRHGQPERPITLCHCGLPTVGQGMCKKHYASWYYYNVLGTGTAGIREDLRHSDVGYSGAHNRVLTVKGRAATHSCVECNGPAKEWALKADAVELLFGAMPGRETLTAYSLNPDDYVPMCSNCHRAYDAKHKNRNYKTQDARWEVA